MHVTILADGHVQRQCHGSTVKVDSHWHTLYIRLPCIGYVMLRKKLK